MSWWFGSLIVLHDRSKLSSPSLELCRSLGIDFVSVTEAVDTSVPACEMLFQMIGAVAQFERSLIGERVRAGIDNARKKGKILGRPALRVLNQEGIAYLRRMRRQGGLPFRRLAERFRPGARASVTCSQRSMRRGKTHGAGKSSISVCPPGAQSPRPICSSRPGVDS